MFYSVKLTVLLLGSKQLEMDKIFFNFLKYILKFL